MIKSILFYASIVFILLITVIVIFINTAPQFGGNPSESQKNYYRTLSNYRENGFETIQKTPMMTGQISTWDFLNVDSTRVPDTAIIPNKINYSFFKDNQGEGYKIAWLGHSGFIININEKIILLDPMLGSHAAPVPIPQLRRYTEIVPIEPESMKRVDIVLFSHDHYDHLDHSTIKLIKNNVKNFVVPLGIGNHLKRWGVNDNQITELNWNDTFELDDIEYVCLPARHFSGRGPLNRNSTLWSSWAIKSQFVKIYFSGDSGYGDHYKSIGDKHGPFDISLLDCGQYNRAWKFSHMFPSEAVLAAKDLDSDFFMPIHWAGFTLAMHPWDEPVKEAIKFADKLGLKYLTPEIGEIITQKNLDSARDEWWLRY